MLKYQLLIQLKTELIEDCLEEFEKFLNNLPKLRSFLLYSVCNTTFPKIQKNNSKIELDNFPNNPRRHFKK